MYNVDEKLAEAFIVASSGGTTNFCSFSKHSQLVNLSFSRPSVCDVETEFLMQRCRWGLFGIFGYVARKAGFEGWFPTLLNASPNIEYGVKHIAKLALKYTGDDLISAFNYGSPRNFDGGYSNHAFVNKVRQLLG